MTGRFLYHAFWNFYDYMGTLVLSGAVYALVAFGLFAAGLALMEDRFNVLSVASCSVLLQLFLLYVILAALLPYCARAARGEPARWKHLLPGPKSKWVVALILFAWLTVFALLLLNFGLYFKLRLQVSPGFGLILSILNAAIGWTILVLCMLLLPWLCAATFVDEPITARAALRNSLMAVALLPGTWILIHLLGGVLLIFGLYTKIGLLFFVPVMVSLGQTAYHMAVQYSAFLGHAKEELGAQLPLRRYKRRASELILEWEYRQRRRTFKELVRPWEY